MSKLKQIIKIYDNSKEYYNDKNQLHRLDGPAVHTDGFKFWYRNDKYHRVDGPAIEYPDGDKYWYQNNKRHRENGPAAINSNGTKYWYQNDKKHREDGPAVINSNGYKAWYQNGKYHREDGPAVINSSGYKEWYINDTKYTEKEYNIKIAEMNKKESCCSANVNFCSNCGFKLKDTNKVKKKSNTEYNSMHGLYNYINDNRFKHISKHFMIKLDTYFHGKKQLRKWSLNEILEIDKKDWLFIRGNGPVSFTTLLSFKDEIRKL